MDKAARSQLLQLLLLGCRTGLSQYLLSINVATRAGPNFSSAAFGPLEPISLIDKSPAAAAAAASQPAHLHWKRGSHGLHIRAASVR